MDSSLQNNSSDNEEEAPTPRNSLLNKYAFAAAVLASTTSILLGYDIGVMSGAIMYIKENMHISTIQVEILVGSLNVFSLFGSLLAGRHLIGLVDVTEKKKNKEKNNNNLNSNSDSKNSNQKQTAKEKSGRVR